VSVLSAETLENFVAMLGEAALAARRHRAGRAARGDRRASVTARFARVLVAPPGPHGLPRALASLRMAP
jgi:hypothetical protein